MIISIIIKTLNEERNIARAIESALAACTELNDEFEIIVADSLSDDSTVEIAKDYPVKVVQLLHREHRSCGIGAELGYRYSSGKYIYILDGDMELCTGFLTIAIQKLEENSSLAGVAGLVEEMVVTNSAILGRKIKAETSTPNNNPVCLNMGGLYRRVAIEQIGYLTNRNLHSFEEFELGIRLIHHGWQLERINQMAIKHYGPNCSSFDLLIRRWRTSYALGNGELLRQVIGKPYFFSALVNLRVYRVQLCVILFWILNFFILQISMNTGLLLIAYSWLCVLLSLIVLKGKLSNAVYSITAWHLGVMGLLIGVTKQPQGQPDGIIESRRLI